MSLGDRRYITAVPGYPEIASTHSHAKATQFGSDACVDPNRSVEVAEELSNVVT